MDWWNGAIFLIRMAQLGSLAQEHGWTFYPIVRDYDLPRHHPGFSCLRQGDQDRFAFNIISGDYQGYSFRAFDYHYQTVMSRSRRMQERGWGAQHIQDHEFSAVLVETDQPLPSLSIRPSNSIWRGIGDFLGASGIQFELASFNEQFFVEAEDPRWAYEVLPQATLEFLLQSPRFQIDMSQGSILLHRAKILDPPQFIEALELILGILKRLPQVL